MKYAALALLLAVPAAAQDRAAEIDFQNALADGRRAAAAATEKTAAVGRALVAMGDGPEAAGRVVAYLRDRGIEVKVAAQAEASKTVVADGRTTVTLSDALPAYPRVYGPLIAKEVGALMYADMPACAERSYMRRALAARVWAELGGEPAALPVIEGTKGLRVPAVSDEISVWADPNGVEMALYRVGRAEGLPGLPELEQKAGDAAEKARLQAADARFVAFVLDERLARRDAGLR